MKRNFSLFPLILLYSFFGLSLIGVYGSSPFTGILGLCGLIGLIVCAARISSSVAQWSHYPAARIWHACLWSMGILTFLVGWYVVHALTPTSITITLLLCSAITTWIHIHYKEDKHITTPVISEQHNQYHLSLKTLELLIPLGLQGCLWYALIQKTTTLALGSPWLLVGPRFFIVYGLAVCSLLLVLWRHPTPTLWHRLVIINQYALTLCVAVVIYALGFGYDPFLHRAAEQEILTHGAIFPKTPFYLGQYILVVTLSHITNIPLFFLDVWLVPVLASISLPLCLWYALHHGAGYNNRLSSIGSLCLLLYPLSVFFVTTPHNLSTLLTLLVFCLGIVGLKIRSFFPILFGLAVYACLIHPLSGVFGLIYVLLLFLYAYRESYTRLFRYGSIATMLFSCISLPILFFSYLYTKDIVPPSIVSVFNRIPLFISLFERPYYFINRDTASFLLDSIYIYQYAIPVLIIVLFLYWHRQKNMSTYFNILPVLVTFSIIINMFFLSTWVIISALNTFEQIQYAERLRHIILYPLLFGAVCGMLLIIHKWKHRTILISSICACLSIMITTSWYLTYPQRNEKIHFPGYNVTSADKKAAQLIYTEQTAEHIRPVVLSTILTAAASIEQYGFSTYYDTASGTLFYYAVPSGSPLATAYGDMLYHGQQRETIDAIFTLTNADRVYFLVPSYWHQANMIIEGAKKTADSYEIIEQGAITLFRYNRHQVK